MARKNSKPTVLLAWFSAFLLLFTSAAALEYDLGGPSASVGSPLAGGTANRFVTTDSSGNLQTDADTQFDGTLVTLTSMTATTVTGTTVSVTNLNLPNITAGGIVFSGGSNQATGSGVLTNGQLLIGDGTGAPAVAALTGTSNQLTVTNGAGTITLSTPQNTDTGASFRIARMGIGMAATTNHLIETSYAQSIASLHNVGVEFHQEGTGTGSKEIDGGVFEAVYNQSAGTHSGLQLGVSGVLEVLNGTQSGPAVAVQGFSYLGAAAGVTVSSNTYLFEGTSYDLGSGGSYAAPHHVFHANPIPSGWTSGDKVAFFSMGGDANYGAFVSRGGYSTFNSNQSASTFTVMGATENDLLKVDGVTDRVGIGQGAPTTKLHLSSGIFTTDGTTAYHTFNMNVTTPTAVADQASIWAVNVDASAEMKVIDGAGNITQISPHDPLTGKWGFDSVNAKTGRHVRVPDMEKVLRLLEGLTGESLMEITYDAPTEKRREPSRRRN